MKQLIFCLVLIVQSVLRAEVYDCFTFFNEFELLRLRLEELHEVVDHFVIVEGSKSYTGNDKPLYFENRKKDFAKFEDKIIHLIIDEFPGSTGNEDDDHWNREIYSRNFMMNGLKGCKEDDIIFISDLDEIPRMESVLEIRNYLDRLVRLQNNKMHINENHFVCELSMRLFMFQMNLESPIAWVGGSKAIPYWFLKKKTPWDIKIYHHFHKDTHIVANAGWHFTGMGGDALVLYKWQNTAPISDKKESLSLLESNAELLGEFVESKKEEYTTPVKIDSTFPKYFLDNLDYYKSIDWIADVEEIN